MRLLVANIPLPQNRFLVDLNAALAERVSLTLSHEDFWEMKGEYDVIHLHFPEYLTYKMEEAYENGMPETLMEELEARLRFWAERSRIVITRHVLLPHDAVHDPRWERLYELVYRYCDGVAHFAGASIAEFRERYRNTTWFRGREPEHAIIPHHNYTSLPNEISREAARRQLGLPADAAVMLVFGAIRSDAERQLILDTFQNLRFTRKHLLVSRWREILRQISWIRLKYWVRDLTRLYYRLHPRYHFNYGFVEEPDTQLYLNAADVLFIPRLWVLNSGNVTLGMTFGKVVVGPDSWDVGELLKETGNPVFDPDHPETAVAAIEEGFRLAAEGVVGPSAQKKALDEWTAGQCAEMYVALYERCCGL
jgi:hypothetical protein